MAAGMGPSRTIDRCLIKRPFEGVAEAVILSENGRGRDLSLNLRFVSKIGKAWIGLGLTLGRANGGDARARPGVFKQFCNAAFAAVGSNATISEQDIKNFKRISQGDAP